MPFRLQSRHTQRAVSESGRTGARRASGVDSQAASEGLSVAQYCRDNGLHEANFHAWWHRLAKLSGQSPRGAVKLAGGKQKPEALCSYRFHHRL